MSDNFCDTPMQGTDFYRPDAPKKGGPGLYDGEDTGAFSEYRRTPSPNSVPEKIRDGSVPKPSGENDQF